jgi:hypothetical protein
MIIDQSDRDVAVCSLFSKMNEVYVSLTKAGLSEIESVKEVVERISQQTLECAYFIREYAQNQKFRKSVHLRFFCVTRLNLDIKERDFSRILFLTQTSACKFITTSLMICGNNSLVGLWVTRS